MHARNVVIALGVFPAFVLSTPALLRTRQSDTCSTSSGAGFCEDTSNECYGGNFYSGYCPGSSDNECCVAPCSTPSGDGNCEYTSNSCSGSFVSGYCSGPDGFECCVTGTGTSSPPPSGTSGFDLSGTPSADFWSCAASSYGAVALEGYIQGCGQGGEVKNVFVQNYQNAVNAGFSRIDAYMFPCTGTQSNGVACKDPQTQLDEFLGVISDNGMNLGYLWFDIEPTSTANGDACNAWNLGASENEALAQQWVSLLQQSGMNWGIYANGNQWTQIFASRSTDIGSQLPLWAVQDDGTPGVDTVTTFMGGWTSAVAKQYSENVRVCGQGVDLDSFS